MAVQEAAVAATKIRASLLLTALCFTPLQAAVLPEERADALYHSYSGGGVTINGPSVLVRKNFKDKVSVYTHYYSDFVSSASIDVITSGSKYSEKRTEVAAGSEFLINSTLYSFGYSQSSENDYLANTAHFGLSQDFFGNLSTLSMGYALGKDTVMVNGDEDQAQQFEKDKTRQNFNLGFSQVATKNLLFALDFETIIDEGYLNNPYRSVRYYEGTGAGTQSERYPNTHNSDALALRGIYYLPYKASIQLQAKAFTDSWGITAHTYEARYVHPIGREWLFEARARTYGQTEADFYADIFPRKDFQTFLGRDKELSRFNTQQIGLGVTYKFNQPLLGLLHKSSLNFYWDGMHFNYHNFRNASLSKPPAEGAAPYKIGSEPLYSFDANVLRIYFSAFY